MFRLLFAALRLGTTLFNIIMVFNLGLLVMTGSAAFYRGDDQDIPPHMQKFINETHNRALVTVAHTFVVSLLELVCCSGLIILVGYRFIRFCTTFEASFDEYMC